MFADVQHIFDILEDLRHQKRSFALRMAWAWSIRWWHSEKDSLSCLLPLSSGSSMEDTFRANGF